MFLFFKPYKVFSKNFFNYIILFLKINKKVFGGFKPCPTPITARYRNFSLKFYQMNCFSTQTL